MPRGRNRRAGAEIRRRHHHAPRLGRVRHRRQPGRGALLRRGRGYLAEALCNLGLLVAAQPDQIAYIIFDASVRNSFMPTLFPPIEAPTIAELAGKFELDPAALEKTIADFNAAVRPGTFDHTILDDCRTEGIRRRRRTGRGGSRRRLILPIRFGPASPSPISVRA